MRKILALVLALAMTLSLCSCALFDNLTAYGLYLKAMKDIKDANGMDVDAVINMSMDMLGQSIDFAMDMSVKQNGDNMYMMVDYGELLGMALEMTVVDGYAYVNTEGVKVKYAIPEEEKAELQQDQVGQIPELTEDVFEGVEIVKNDDGTKQISFVINEGAMNGVIETLLGETDDTVSIDEVLYTMTFDKDNKLISAVISMDMDMTSSGITVGATIDMECIYNNIGTAPEVALPADASEYTEMEYPEGGLM